MTNLEQTRKHSSEQDAVAINCPLRPLINLSTRGRAEPEPKTVSHQPQAMEHRKGGDSVTFLLGPPTAAQAWNGCPLTLKKASASPSRPGS